MVLQFKLWEVLSLKTSKEKLDNYLGVEQQGDNILITVRNSGRWVEPNSNHIVASTGVGIVNLKARLKNAYGENYRIDKYLGDSYVEFKLRIGQIDGALG